MYAHTVLPEQFAWCDWWTPARQGRSWFFHTRRELVAPPSHTVDFDTLDTGVAGLVGKLHGWNIPTWPSCEGHWFDPNRAKEMYAQLQKDAWSVQNTGLPLKHVETGKHIHFYSPRWHLPWPTWHSFFLDVSRGNGLGLVAFCPPQGHPLWNWNPNVRHVSVTHENIGPHPAVMVRVRSHGPNPQRACWEAVTRSL